MVPKAVSEWKARGVSRAQALQEENRALFLSAFSRGLAVTGFRLSAEGDGIFELAKVEENVPRLL